MSEIPRNLALAIEAAQAAAKRITIKRSNDRKWNHARVLEFLKLEIDERQKRGLDASDTQYKIFRSAYVSRWGEDPPEGF